MSQTEFFRSLEERPLRMAAEPRLPRRQIVLRQTARPVPASDSLMPVFLILGFAFWLVYAFMRTIP